MSKVLWEGVNSKCASKARESTKAMSFAFALFDFQREGVRRRAYCTTWSVDIYSSSDSKQDQNRL